MRDDEGMADQLGSVTRALETLRLFDGARHSLSVTELAALLGCSTSTAQRTIATLAEQHFLRRDDETRTYRLGASVLHLSRAWRSAASLGSLARPVLERLAHDTGLNTTFAVPDHAHMRVVLSIDGAEGPLRDYPMASELFPAHAGAISKAYYAQLPHDLRARFIGERPMARFTAETKTDPKQLEEDFLDIRARGYCHSRGEYDTNVSALAAPVWMGKEPLGAIALSSLSELVVHPSLVDALLAATGELGRLLTREV
ncbi:IclR family transcriptional regulator [Microbacterium sp. MYb62]|nr:IclR family transcriptional regulator [Microbacterium sp. MYb62]